MRHHYLEFSLSLNSSSIFSFSFSSGITLMSVGRRSGKEQVRSSYNNDTK